MTASAVTDLIASNRPDTPVVGIVSTEGGCC